MSDQSDTSGKDQYYTNESPQQKFDGSTEFSISYNQARQLGSEDVSNGMTRVAPIHAVPGFSYMVDSPSPQREDKATNDGNFDMDFSAEMTKAKHLKKTMSNPPNGIAGGRAFENDPRLQKGYGKDGSSHGSAFVCISEISLRTQPSDLPPPSRPPPAAEVKKGDSSKLVSKRNALAFGGTSGDCSPPFFDVEVDASSSAAVSAAAMKEAMEKAQAKLKSAKELMERKKEGLQSSYKLGSKKYTKEKAGELGKNIDEANRLKDERVNTNFEREDGVTNLLAREEKKKASKTALEVPELYGEELLSPFENNVKEKPEKESWSSYKIDEASEWKEATEFFELLTTNEPKKDFEQANSKKIFVPSIQIHEREQSANEAVESKQSGNNRKEKTAREDYNLGEVEEKQKGEELCGFEGQNAKSKEEKETYELKDRERQLKVTREVCESGENKKSSGMVKQLAETNENFAEADKSVKAKESKSKSKKATKRKDNQQKMMATDKVDEIEKQLKLFHETVDKEDRQRRAFDQDSSENRFKEVFDQAGKETKVKKGLEQEENETWLKEILEKVESDRRPKEVVTQQENEKLLKQPLERGKAKRIEREKEKEREAVGLEDEKRHDKTREREEAEKRLESVSGDREIRKKAPEQEDSKGRSKLGPDKEEAEVEQLDSQNMSKEVLEREETKQVLKDAVDSDVTKRLNKAHERIEKDGTSTEVKVDERTYVKDEEEDILQSDKAHKLDCGKNTQPAELAYDVDESHGKVETPQEILAYEEMKDVKAQIICNENQPGIVGRESEYVDINLEASIIAEIHHFQMDDAKEAIPMDVSVKNTRENIEIKPQVSEKESAAFEMESVPADGKLRAFGNPLETLDDRVKKTGETGSVIGEPYDEKVKSCSPVGSDSEKQESEFANEWKEKGEERPQVQASLNKEEKKESTMPTQSVKESTEDRRKTEAAEPPRAEEKPNNRKSVQQVNASQAMDRKDKISGDVENERTKRVREMEKERLRKAEEERERDEKQKNQKSAQQVNTSQTTERKEKTSGGVETERTKREREMENERARKIEEERQKNQKSAQQVNASQTIERKEKAPGEVETERMRREREMENERLRKIEEEREREREREKDRMAVDLATLEARERVFGESRERAERTALERATAEARQRAMAEARERLEKACAEAREKSLAGKTAMEARIRAERAAVERATAEARERAAVERATAEARERAAERAMAERAAFEARERVQRSVSDKFSASSRNSGMRQSSSSSDLQDLQFQSSGVPRYQYSSVYSERYEGVEGESAQRCKARLERHRRTAERAAKALAEKNMRDLITQREQAERNRLAETLDADVRRWSSGKEGNLRALLSTLQYILGPDSGWQPIPLTEVITSAAVKRAYRKATLCVHPDKLQQRGASIQQKYICEKVFDLLKEAWNKFNSEER